MDELSMIVCDTCGSVVHPECLQLHSDWHDDQVTKHEVELDKIRAVLVKELKQSLANEDRTQR